MKEWLLLFALVVILVILTFTYLAYFKVVQSPLHIFTITNTLDKWELEKLKESVIKYGSYVNVIFTEDEIGRLPTGFNSKITRLYEAIVNHEDSDIICFVDGFDVLFGANVSELYSKFKAMGLGDKVLFSAEKSSSCWPVSDQYTDYCSKYAATGKKVNDGDYGYLNSGMFIGTAKGIKTIIQQRMPELQSTRVDDQGFYGETYLFSDQIVLDSKCELFQNLIGDQFHDLVWDDMKKRWYNKYTNSFPVVFQGNGFSRPELFEIIMPKIL